MWTKLEMAMLVAVVVGTQAYSRASAAATPEAEHGRALFVTYCASCHGEGSRRRTGRPTVKLADWSQFAKRNGQVSNREDARIIDGRDVAAWHLSRCLCGATHLSSARVSARRPPEPESKHSCGSSTRSRNDRVIDRPYVVSFRRTSQLRRSTGE